MKEERKEKASPNLLRLNRFETSVSGGGGGLENHHEISVVFPGGGPDVIPIREIEGGKGK